MSDTPYSNRELDSKFDGVHEKLDAIIVQTTATNGKVRKVILALVLAFGLIVGLGFEQIAPALALVLAA